MSQPTDVLETLRSSELFAALEASLLEHMTLAFREAWLAPGEILMHQGEDADYLAVVESALPDRLNNIIRVDDRAGVYPVVHGQNRPP